MLLQLAILGGMSASHGLGYHPGLVVRLQADHPAVHAAVWASTADKYIGDGYSYGMDAHVRALYRGQVYVGPGLYVGHTSTSQWDKTSTRPTVVIGRYSEGARWWIAGHVWDTSPNRIRGVSATAQIPLWHYDTQGWPGRVVFQPSVDWMRFDGGRNGVGVKLLVGVRQ
jgi:hypothetical protein